MEEKKSEEGGFRVVDRRRFTESGESRSNDEADLKESASREAHGRSVVPPSAKREERNQGPSGADTSSAQSSSETHGEALDFSSFVISLATQAMIMLGEMPHPESGSVMLNLDGARQTVDILAMLEEKTKGNLTPSEARLIDEVLSSLRLAYVGKRTQVKGN